MRQCSIGEQKAAHNLQTGYPQARAGHLPWWEALKQQQKFVILMEDSILETEKGKNKTKTGSSPYL